LSRLPDSPVQQPTTFELRDQPQDGKAIGRVIPEALLSPDMAELDGVTIWRGAHRASRPDGAAGANDIFDNDVLTEGARHVLAYDAGSEIERAASGERHDQCDRTRGKGLRLSDPLDGWDSGSTRYEMQKISAGKFHGGLSLFGRFIRSPRRQARAA